MTKKTIPMLAIAAISVMAILGLVSANTDHAASAATGGITPWTTDLNNLQTMLQNIITNSISDESTARKAGDAALSTQITDLSNLVTNPPPKPEKVNAFLAIDGIEGESTDASHPKTIEIDSWSFGETQSATTSGGGGGAGKVSMQDFHFITKTVDKSSPKLFLVGASGEHIKDATLFVRKAGSNSDYLKIKLTDILVSSYQTGGSSSSDIPTESVSLNFAKIEFSYTGVDAEGKLLPAVDVGWDILANKVS
jgi:type VI secretion system secreted protein Hcp